MVSSIGYTWGNTGPGGQYIYSIYTRLVCVANDSSLLVPVCPCSPVLWSLVPILGSMWSPVLWSLVPSGPWSLILGPDPWLHVVPLIHYSRMRLMLRNLRSRWVLLGTLVLRRLRLLHLIPIRLLVRLARSLSILHPCEENPLAHPQKDPFSCDIPTKSCYEKPIPIFVPAPIYPSWARKAGTHMLGPRW